MTDASELLDLGDPLLEIDASWRIVHVNASMRRLAYAKPPAAPVTRLKPGK